MNNLLINLEFVYSLKNNLFFKIKYFLEKALKKITFFLGFETHYFFNNDYIIKTNDFSWVIRAHSDFDEVIRPNYEREMLPYFVCTGVFVDVGAHIGKWSLLLSKTATKVYAFEPNPDIYRYLSANIALNKISNITTFNEGLSSSEGMLKFSPESPEHSGSSKVTDDGTMEIKTITLDSVAIPTVELMKIDVEGHELEVLKGAQETLKNTQRVLCEIWEYHPKRQETFDFMERQGFNRKQIDPNNFFFTKNA